MATNTNSKTGLGYGVISANNVSMEVLDVGGAGWVSIDEENYYDEVEKKLLAWLNEDGEDVVVAARAVGMERNIDFLDNLTFLLEEGPANGVAFHADDLEFVMQPIYDAYESGADTWEYSDAEYHLMLDTNENILWVMDSPYKADVNPAFQLCYPNCGNLDEPSEYGYEYHALGPEYFDEYSPCPYVPVPIGKEE